MGGLADPVSARILASEADSDLTQRPADRMGSCGALLNQSAGDDE